MECKCKPKGIIIIVFVVVMAGCGIGKSHYDVDNKMNYTQNQMLLIAAIISDYQEKNSSYPDSLSIIEKDIHHYLIENPTFTKQYLTATWTKEKISIFETATGYPIRYLNFREKSTYYLYGSYGNIAKYPLDVDALDRYRYGVKISASLYLVVNGQVVSGSLLKGQGIRIDKTNMMQYMKKMDIKKRSILL